MSDKQIMKPTYVKVCDLCGEESLQDDGVKTWTWNNFYFDAHYACHNTANREVRKKLKELFDLVLKERKERLESSSTTSS